MFLANALIYDFQSLKIDVKILMLSFLIRSVKHESFVLGQYIWEVVTQHHNLMVPYLFHANMCMLPPVKFY